jgi:diguanylate cyclase (GGDEF)-like protein
LIDLDVLEAVSGGQPPDRSHGNPEASHAGIAPLVTDDGLRTDVSTVAPVRDGAPLSYSVTASGDQGKSSETSLASAASDVPDGLAASSSDGEPSIGQGPGITRDDRHFLELQSTLVLAREKLSLAVDSTGLGLWEVDLLTGERWFSEAAARILGHPVQQPVLREQSLAVIHPDDRERASGIVDAMVHADEGRDQEFHYRLKREDGEGPLWVVSTGRVIRDANGVPLRVIGSNRDVTVIRRQRDELARLAFEDVATRLPNRAGLLRWLEEAAGADEALSLLVFDIDDFKRTIGLIGSSAADGVIGAFATRLRKALAVTHCFARLGGDEFAVAVSSGAGGGDASRAAKTIRAALRRPFITADGQAVFVEVSIGIASINPTTRSIEDLLARASLSLREVKAKSKGSTLHFTAAMQSDQAKARSVIVELPRAVSQGEFEVHYQPQVNLSDRSLSGAEALLRWRHPERGLLSPAAFIDELARSRWASAVGTRVLERACADTAALTLTLSPFQMGVNLFSSQFTGQKLDQVVKRLLEKYDLLPEMLEIEITENIVLADNDDILKTLRKLRNLGCGIAFDDYGTGYASLSMLKRYPITRLKIDRSFIANICDSPADRAIVEAVLGLGRTFSIDVIAEGVETEAQHATLVDCGCSKGQGFLYGRPMPFEALLVRVDQAGPP